jgi:hypothetical protein
MIERFGKKFEELTIDDLDLLQSKMPENKDNKYNTIWDITQWAMTPAGTVVAIFAGAQKLDKSIKLEDIKKLGKPIELMRLAGELVGMYSAPLGEPQKK